jgi:hypothetical protein
MREDQITVTVLDDGSVTVETDDLEGPNHMQAERLVEFMARLMGGETQTTKKRQGHVHHHEHIHH